MSASHGMAALMISILFLSLICDITTNPCKLDVKVEQVIHNEGFHRNITYRIVFTEDYEDRWSYRDCVLGLEQTLPAGVYTNPDELGDLRRINRLNAIPKNRINVELPTEQSEPNVVYIMDNVRDSQVYMWLPVHARYHQAVPGGSMARNEIGAPKLYLRCPDQRLDLCKKAVASSMTFLCNGSSKEKCIWKSIPFTMMTDMIVWDVPVGNTDDYYIVAGGTSIVIIVGSLYLLKIIHEYKVRPKQKLQ
ncbi:phosphatidylinositol-glycan biosynthesis class X protein [Achroia grisella]|uniref:phosphatidylinositol-glycan biosynthesis class X protein n=1 Tax=Achroia grisella TaxID=688607 RepID=UPI0027D20E33|nr:phosphatidylinositol-glycan biosynthesis class X protein [Achroia grisella]